MLLDEVITIFGESADDNNVLHTTEAQFNRDFGPWRAGEELSHLIIDFNMGRMIQRDETGKIVNQCKFRIEAL